MRTVSSEEIAVTLGKSVANIKAFRAKMRTKAFWVELNNFKKAQEAPGARLGAYVNALSGIRPAELVNYPLEEYERH